METDRTIYFSIANIQNTNKTGDVSSQWHLNVTQRNNCEINFVYPEQENEGFCKQNLEIRNKPYVFVIKRYDKKC